MHDASMQWQFNFRVGLYYAIKQLPKLGWMQLQNILLCVLLAIEFMSKLIWCLSSACLIIFFSKGLGEPSLSPALERSVIAYSTLNKFLASFVEHSSAEFDYTVKDKLLLERILDMELTSPLEKGFFYKDDTKSFTSALLYGVEWSLLLFDMFMFAVVDMAATSYVLAALLTYFMDVLILTARDTLGKKNVARKTLVHERFLI